jgi:uncharacterized protein
MINLAKLFGKSPFAPLQTHMSKVESCVKELTFLFKAVAKKDMKEIEHLGKKISELEHEADITKNDIRNHLPKSLFLPIDRADLLEILSIQDSFADIAEDIAVIATLKPLENYEDLKEDFEVFCADNLKTFELAKKVIKEFDILLESSFGGIEAEKVKGMIEELAYKEDELDRLQYKILKKLLSLTDKMDYANFFLWQTIVKQIGQLSNYGEKLGKRIRMILELK